MSEVKHTPGPWGVNQSADEGAWDIGTGEWQGDSYGGLQIATAWGFYGRAEADARLIAAAPELLQALEAMVALLDADGWSWPQQLADARAAIAKAKGAA